MPAETIAASSPPSRAEAADGRQEGASGWPMALLLLGLGLAGLGALFADEAVSAVRVWESSETYNHCWLILPIAAWLAWTRRERLVGLQPRPTPLFALAALPVGLAWLLAERLGIMEGRQLTALALVYVLTLTILGWRICRAMAAPLLYLVFLVPFGAFTTIYLQRITAWMIDLGLSALEIPHYVDDLIIETTYGRFLVAEACSGLRFLIAALAFGALYAIVMFRSPSRRLIVFGLAILVPIVANGIRAFGIVVLGKYLGSAEAAAADHVIYGWIFFSIVLLLLIALGLPFREDGTPEKPPAPPPEAGIPPRPIALAGTALIAFALTAAAPAVALGLNQAGGRAPERLAVRLAPAAECSPGAEGRLDCGTLAVQAVALVFPAQATWSLVSAERYRLAGGGDQDIQFNLATPHGPWQVRQSRDEGRTVALAVWLNGSPVGSGLRARAEQALNSLGAGRGVPVLVAITLSPQPGGGPVNFPQQRTVLQALLGAGQQDLAAAAAARSAGN
jgi:exosortase A